MILKFVEASSSRIRDSSCFTKASVTHDRPHGASLTSPFLFILLCVVGARPLATPRCATECRCECASASAEDCLVFKAPRMFQSRTKVYRANACANEFEVRKPFHQVRHCDVIDATASCSLTTSCRTNHQGTHTENGCRTTLSNSGLRLAFLHGSAQSEARKRNIYLAVCRLEKTV